MSFFLRGLSAAAVTCACVSLAGPAAAAPSARLVYVRSQGAESCPAEGALRDAVSARLGYDPFSAFATDTLFVEITRDRTTYLSTVKLVGGDNIIRGARDLRLRAADCGEVVATLALTVSLAVDPMYFAREGKLPEGLPPGEHTVPPTEDRPPPKIPERPPPDPPVKPPPDRPPPPPSTPIAWRIGAGLIGNVGAAPSANAGAVVGVEARRKDLRAGIEARADLPASGDGAAGRVVSSLVLGTLAPCYTFSAPTFACALASFGVVRATAEDVTQARVRTAFFASGGLRVGVDIALGERWVLQPSIEASLTPTPPVLEINGRGAYTYALVQGNLGIRIAGWP